MSRRLRLLGCLAACLAVPAAARAVTPGYTPIGPPATFHQIVFGLDGTAFATVERDLDDDLPSSPALWRSTDHGSTWSVRYRLPPGSQLIVLGVSPDARTVVVNTASGRRRQELDRIDVATGRAAPLPFWRFLGFDAEGTIYGLTSRSLPTPAGALTRCRRGADICTDVPATLDAEHAVVDPLSVGVLATTAQANGVSQVSTSTDGGATWTAGAVVPGACQCQIAFAGPTPRSLYALSSTALDSSHDAGLTWAAGPAVPAGGAVIAGFAPSASLSYYPPGPPQQLSFTTDDGASFRTVPLAVAASVLAVDPTDASHLFLAQRDSRTTQSHDGGATSADLVDARFGTLPLDPKRTAGAGADIYTGIGDAIWSSSDRGATWTQTVLPYSSRPGQLQVSRDDPRSAYVTTFGGAYSELRTRDGGRTWTPIPGILPLQISTIVAGSPDHVVSGDSESHDGGVTWSLLPPACGLVAVDDATSPTGRRVVCGHYAVDGEIDSTAAVTASHYGVFGSPDAPGQLAVAWSQLLGDVGPGGAFTPLIGPTDIFGPAASPAGSAEGAWPARDGTTFYAADQQTGVLWVRRGSGRWWRLQHEGAGVGLMATLDATHALVSSLAGAAVLDLARPAVDPPQIQKGPGGLTCAVPWSRADADTTAYAWLRDGALLRGATRLQYQATARDRGHDLACRATATTSFGSTEATSTLAYTVPGAPVAPPRPHLTGAPRAGSRLTCSARTAVTWLRAGRVVPGLHGRSYRVRPLDRGRAIACRTVLADGTVVESPQARISSASGA